MNCAPVVLFVYNRKEHAKKVIDALANCILSKETHLYIFSDGAKNEKSLRGVSEVREYLKSLNDYPFSDITVTYSDYNKGLANSVIGGVSEVIKKHKKAIVLEDDTVPSVNFLTYMNECLETYKMDSRVWAIGGYLIPISLPSFFCEDIFLAKRGSSCAWATWIDRWETVDWKAAYYKKFRYNIFERRAFNTGGNDLSLMLDRQMHNKIDSWAIRFAYARYSNNMFWILPSVSKVYNVGFDNSGTHSGCTDKFDNIKVDDGNKTLNLTGAKFYPEIDKILYEYYDLGFIQRVKTYIKTNIIGK